AEAATHGLCDRIAVDGVVYRLTQRQVVLKRRFQGVEEILSLVAAEGRFGIACMRDLLRGWNVATKNVHREIGSASSHLVELGRGLDDYAIRNAVQIRKRFAIRSHAPVVFVAFDL